MKKNKLEISFTVISINAKDEMIKDLDGEYSFQDLLLC
jgi:hypothetical protein